MSARVPITKAADLDALDLDEMVEGYWDGYRGEPEPGDNRSLAFWHGWRNGAVDGQRYEISTGTPDKGTAERIAPGHFAAAVAANGQRGFDPETLTLTQAAQAYKAFRQPSKNDARYIDRLVVQIDPRADKPAVTVLHADLVAAAEAPSQGRIVTMTKPFLTPAELADKALVSDQAAYFWLAQHPGLGVKVAGRWRIRPEVADAILAGKPLAEAAS